MEAEEDVRLWAPECTTSDGEGQWCGSCGVSCGRREDVRMWGGLQAHASCSRRPAASRSADDAVFHAAASPADHPVTPPPPPPSACLQASPGLPTSGASSWTTCQCSRRRRWGVMLMRRCPWCGPSTVGVREGWQCTLKPLWCCWPCQLAGPQATSRPLTSRAPGACPAPLPPRCWAPVAHLHLCNSFLGPSPALLPPHLLDRHAHPHLQPPPLRPRSVPAPGGHCAVQAARPLDRLHERGHGGLDGRAAHPVHGA
jgi:hypothetical protein